MLWHKIIGAGGISKGITLADTKTDFSNTDNSFTIDVSGEDIQADDLIVICLMIKKPSNTTTSISGFTKNADVYVNSTDDSNLSVFNKVANGTETSLTVTTNVTQGCRYNLYVWRGVDTTTPIDVAIATNTSSNATMASSPNVTTATDNAVVMQFIGVAGAGARPLDAITQPSGTDNFISTGNNIKLASCSSVQQTAGTTSLNNFGGGSNNSGHSSIAATLTIRPA